MLVVVVVGGGGGGVLRWTLETGQDLLNKCSCERCAGSVRRASTL